MLRTYEDISYILRSRKNKHKTQIEQLDRMGFQCRGSLFGSFYIRDVGLLEEGREPNQDALAQGTWAGGFNSATRIIEKRFAQLS